MPIELTMPRLSDTMEQGTIIQWRVKEGDSIASGTAVADVETDKATMEMQAYDDGVLARILVPAGKLVPIGTVIAVLAEKGEDPAKVASAAGGAGGAATTPSAAAVRATSSPAPGGAAGAESGSGSTSQPSATASAPTPSASTPPSAPAPASAPAHPSDGGMRVSPVARKIADEHGLDLSTVRGRGPGGRVVKEDVLEAIARRDAGPGPGATGTTSAGAAGSPALVPAVAAARAEGRTAESGAATAPVPPLGSVLPLSGMRLTIAKRLVESTTTIPHYQVSMRLDMDPLLSLRETLNRQLEAQGVKLSVNDFVVRACALAMHRHPEFNASWGGAEGVRVHQRVNVGMAISLPRERGGGLVVGVIRDADRKGLRQISEESKALSAKARGRGLSAEEMSESTFTISNLGMFGVEHFTAIINPPNSAILAVGAALEQPVVRNGQIVVGHEMTTTLSLDHRVIDGAMAAEYLRTLKGLMEGPAALLV